MNNDPHHVSVGTGSTLQILGGSGGLWYGSLSELNSLAGDSHLSQLTRQLACFVAYDSAAVSTAQNNAAVDSVSRLIACSEGGHTRQPALGQ